MSLVDAVECVIACTKCDNKIGGFGIGDYELAEEAFTQGWYENRNCEAICPKCDKRKRNKKTTK